MASLHRHTELLKQPVCQLINWQFGSGRINLDCVFVWPGGVTAPPDVNTRLE